MNFEYMKNFMDSLTEWIIPGNSVVIYKDGKKVFEYSSGYSDLEKKIKKTGEEQLYIYSCSKVATVTAALQLYEQGKFLLSDPLYEYLPEFKKMYVKDGDRIKAAEIILGYGWGKPKQQTELTGKDNGPLLFIWDDKDA